MGRKPFRLREYDDPVERVIGLRNLGEDELIEAIDEKYKWIPSHVQILVGEGFALDDIRKRLHIGEVQLMKALRTIKKDTLAKLVERRKT